MTEQQFLAWLNGLLLDIALEQYKDREPSPWLSNGYTPNTAHKLWERATPLNNDNILDWADYAVFEYI